MPLEIIIGDLLEQNTEAITIPLVPHTGPSSKYSRITYERAGCEALMKARLTLPRTPDGVCGITEGFGLNADYVFHARVPEWFGGGEGERRSLTHCYCDALKKAAAQNIGSIAFPLLGVGSNRVPPEEAYTIAKDAISGYLRAHDLTISVSLVVHPTVTDLLSETQKADFAEMPNQSENRYRIWEHRREEEFLKAGVKKCEEDLYYQKRIKAYFDKYLKISKSSLADTVHCHRSTVSRFAKGDIRRTAKATVIAMAVCLELSDEERYDFIRSADHAYPVTAQDYLIENLIASGHRTLSALNEALYDVNPKMVLVEEKDDKHRSDIEK